MSGVESGLPTEDEREALDRASSVFGWQHLARYSGMSTEWLDVTLLAIVRSALAAHTCPIPPGGSDV